MFYFTNHSIHFQVVCNIVSLQTCKRSTKESDWVFQYCVVKLLLEYRAEGDTTAICFQDEVSLMIRNSDNPMFKLLLLEFFETEIQFRLLLHNTRAEHFVQGAIDVREIQNKIAIIVAQFQE